jgi:hypothetical protein
MIFKMVLNSEIYEELNLKTCITTKVLKMAYTYHLHVFKKNHGTPPISLNSWGENKCESAMQGYVMHMT